MACIKTEINIPHNTSCSHNYHILSIFLKSETSVHWEEELGDITMLWTEIQRGNITAEEAPKARVCTTVEECADVDQTCQRIISEREEM